MELLLGFPAFPESQVKTRTGQTILTVTRTKVVQTSLSHSQKFFKEKWFFSWVRKKCPVRKEFLARSGQSLSVRMFSNQILLLHAHPVYVGARWIQVGQIRVHSAFFSSYPEVPLQAPSVSVPGLHTGPLSLPYTSFWIKSPLVSLMYFPNSIPFGKRTGVTESFFPKRPLAPYLISTHFFKSYFFQPLLPP